jgi:hypothetical protein
MGQDVHLNVLLPRNRNRPGRIRVELNGAPQAEFRILGRGSTTVKGRPTGNPTLSPLLHAGNTPTGDYASPGIVSTAGWDRDSYGPWGAIRLRAVAGEALLAERLGREGLLIHGGAEGRFSGFRSTLGCLRLHNADMKALIGMISGAGDNATTQMCDSVFVRITVRE